MKRRAISLLLVTLMLLSAVGVVSVSAQTSATISLNPNAANGYTYTASTSGTHRITYINGAFNPWPPNTGPGNTWRNSIYIYKNRPISGVYEGACDYQLGAKYGYYSTYAKAEAAAKGSYVDISMKAGDYIILLLPDSNYGDNQGEITVSVSTEPLTASFTYGGVHDSTAANIKVLGISTKNVDEHPMVGSPIRFNASSSTPTTGLAYKWDFGDGTGVTKTTKTAQHVYTEPRKYTVTLTVSDGKGHTAKNSTPLDLSLKVGDLIFIRTAKWSTVFSLFGLKYTHVGMYIGNGQMVEAALTKAHGGKNEGVQISKLSGYFSTGAGGQETFATVFRVKTSNGVKSQAMNYAKARLGRGYDINVKYKQDSPLEYPLGNYYRWYCSELMWASYLQTTSKIDLGRTGPNTPIGVAPDWIAKDTAHLEFVGGHWEHYPS